MPKSGRGGERLWRRCFGGEEDLPLRARTVVKPSVSVMELWIVNALVASELVDPAEAYLLRASFSSERAISNKFSSENVVPPAALTRAEAPTRWEMFPFRRRVKRLSKSLPGPAEEWRRERESV